MSLWRRILYNGIYLLGTPPWERGMPPPEVVAVIEGVHALSAGHALDLGCGTGTTVNYLARHGWKVVGVDFSAIALEKARKAVVSTSGATVIEGDVSRLSDLGIHGPFDLVLDLGCYHSLPASRRPAYVQEVARVTHSGALLLIWAVAATRQPVLPGMPMMHDQEIPDRFRLDFQMEDAPGGKERPWANWYRLRRR